MNRNQFKTIRRTGRQLFLLLALVVFASATLIRECGTTAKETNEPDANKEFYPVTKISDGDTFWVDDGSEKGLKIRLIGVDAPESRRTGRKEIGYYGAEAKAYLTEMLFGNKVRLEYDVGRLDRYNRTLAYAYLPDGTFVNAHLVENGYAQVMTVPPNVKQCRSVCGTPATSQGGGTGNVAKY
jgi:micrococcal nuclease